ncbi:MAG: hypothetical protein ACD_73C00638G0003 [uncultured bacterium]|nr:MAG: hypothetical protein ACD_73C00638G0003 [uncultured bacterium]
MTAHTDKHFEAELKLLKEEILKMGSLVEEMITLSMKALEDRSSAISKKVIQKDPEVNHLEMIIDDHCLELLVRWQPAASDLRFITMSLKISKDLERMGDLAVDICEQVLELNWEPVLGTYDDFKEIGEKTREMVKNALDAFVKQDVELANHVCTSDDEVDALKRNMFHAMIALMQKDSTAVARGTRIILISRHFERIADHATNIAEQVIFMVKGEDIRHRGKTL